MRIRARTLLVSCFAAAAATAASAGTATVSFTNASGFSDAGASPWERDNNLRGLAEHLRTLAQRQLPAGQVLKVEVLDVDLAGTTRPSFRTGRDLRIVKGGADWPSIKLRYSLEANGRTLRSGEESVADMNYSRGFIGRVSEPLQYEKHMLDDWFKSRFVSPAQ